MYVMFENKKTTKLAINGIFFFMKQHTQCKTKPTATTVTVIKNLSSSKPQIKLLKSVRHEIIFEFSPTYKHAKKNANRNGDKQLKFASDKIKHTNPNVKYFKT